MQDIHFFQEDIDLKLREKQKLRAWIRSALSDHKKTVNNINYIFTSDKYLLELNQSYLNHDTFTDIITFDQSTKTTKVEADIYISIDRISENAKKLNISFSDELHRVMMHGVLHLLGYSDKSSAKKKEMRKKENHYLALRF